MDEIQAGVVGILNFQFDVDPEDAGADKKLVEDLGLDSIELVQFALDLEDKFDIEIPDEAFMGAATVGKVVEEIRKLKGVV